MNIFLHNENITSFLYKEDVIKFEFNEKRNTTFKIFIFSTIYGQISIIIINDKSTVNKFRFATSIYRVYSFRFLLLHVFES